MKLTLQQITDGQDEIILRYRERTSEIDSLIRSIELRRDRIYADAYGTKLLIAPADVLYMESVDNAVYIYTADTVAKAELTLAAAENTYSQDGFFRCGKSTVINIYHISRLRSLSGNRVDAAMDNGEHVIISRRYVRALRSILRGE